jgi:putative PIN family toxin of toxin-antitoxin system
VRCFLDSNTIVSGLAFRGNEYTLLTSTFTESEHSFVVYEDVLDEVREVLRRTFPRLRKEAEETLRLLRFEVVSRKDYRGALGDVPRLRDPKDAHVLAAALAARCDLIVTGDRDLLEAEPVEGVKVVRSSEALRILHRSARPVKGAGS